MEMNMRNVAMTRQPNTVSIRVMVALVTVGALIALVAAALGYFAASTLLARSPAISLSDASATARPSSVALQPQPVVLPDATTAETLKGARDYLRTGPEDAKVQVVLFEDGQCPFCKQLSVGPLKQLLDEFVPTGQVAVTYRHFAFLGEESNKLALAMECAGRQDKFWPFHDHAYAHQQPENSGAVTDMLLARWANTIQLEADAFQSCMGDPAIQALIASDLEAGRKLGVRGTPIMFVNGKLLAGAVPYEYLKSAVEAALRTTE